MKKLLLLFCFVAFSRLLSFSQDAYINNNNRISIGLGGENSMIGIDYSRNIYRSNLFLGIGAGLGTGWTTYLRYEPFNHFLLRPFLSSGISYNFSGTLIAAPATSIFSASGGVCILPKWKWQSVPFISLGSTYYLLLSGDTEGGLGGFSLLAKCGLAFGKKKA